MSPPEDEIGFFEPPAYALLIGISEYQHGVQPDSRAEAHEFHNLRCAGKDASDLAELLKRAGFIPDAVKPLINQDATLRQIKGGMSWLRRNCEESENPLVIVFFSGHGMTDARKDHFLVPYDAERNQLAETALWSRDFRNYLDTLKTNRLVVFLDACHAGGVGIDGAKGTSDFDVAELGSGTGRCVVASCQPGEFSYEGESNGIFTGHLLELLRGEGIDSDPIDIFSLYNALKRKVEDSARRLRHASQVPVLEAKLATGIVLAVNKRIRDAKLARGREVGEVRRAFLERVCASLAKKEYNQRLIVIRTLRQYVERQERYPGHDNFYELFEAFTTASWGIDYVCDMLIAEHRDIEARAAEKQTGVEAEAPSKDTGRTEAPAGDAFVGAREVRRVEPEAHKQSPSPRSVSPSRDEARQLGSGDEDYILGELKLSAQFFVPASKLIAVLRAPVTEAGFMQVVRALPDTPDDHDLQSLLPGIVGRFTERWRAAKPARGLSSLYSGKSQV